MSTVSEMSRWINQQNSWSKNSRVPGTVQPVYGAQHPPLGMTQSAGTTSTSPGTIERGDFCTFSGELIRKLFDRTFALILVIGITSCIFICTRGNGSCFDKWNAEICTTEIITTLTNAEIITTLTSSAIRKTTKKNKQNKQKQKFQGKNSI